MIRVITLDREYGSGGPAIAQRLADRLGWALWDERLTREIARLTECDPAVVAGREERGDPMYYRLFKSFLRGSFEGNLQAQRLKPVDADRILEVTGHRGHRSDISTVNSRASRFRRELSGLLSRPRARN